MTAPTEPHFQLVVHNDEVHTFEFVMTVLMRVLNLGQVQAYQITLAVHQKGQAIAWSGPLAEGETKRAVMQNFLEIRDRDEAVLGPVRCTLEPVK